MVGCSDWVWLSGWGDKSRCSYVDGVKRVVMAWWRIASRVIPSLLGVKRELKKYTVGLRHEAISSCSYRSNDNAEKCSQLSMDGSKDSGVSRSCWRYTDESGSEGWRGRTLKNVSLFVSWLKN